MSTLPIKQKNSTCPVIYDGDNEIHTEKGFIPIFSAKAHPSHYYCPRHK